MQTRNTLAMSACSVLSQKHDSNFDDKPAVQFQTRTRVLLDWLLKAFELELGIGEVKLRRQGHSVLLQNQLSETISAIDRGWFGENATD